MKQVLIILCYLAGLSLANHPPLVHQVLLGTSGSGLHIGYQPSKPPLMISYLGEGDGSGQILLTTPISKQLGVGLQYGKSLGAHVIGTMKLNKSLKGYGLCSFTNSSLIVAAGIIIDIFPPPPQSIDLPMISELSAEEFILEFVKTNQFELEPTKTKNRYRIIFVDRITHSQTAYFFEAKPFDAGIRLTVEKESGYIDEFPIEFKTYLQLKGILP
jgi:hypothetical protein